MTEKELHEIQDRIKESTDKRALARIAHTAMVRLCDLVQSPGIISELTLEGGYASRIEYDLTFPEKEEEETND